MGVLVNGPSPFRLMSKVDTKLSEPVKKWFGLSGANKSECGAINFSVVRETRGYEAMREGENGERRRIGSALRELRKRVEAGF